MIPALARFVDELRADPRFEPSANEVKRGLRRVYDEGCENADAQTLLDGVAWLAAWAPTPCRQGPATRARPWYVQFRLARRQFGSDVVSARRDRAMPKQGQSSLRLSRTVCTISAGSTV
jgi:hypothetical protein